MMIDSALIDKLPPSELQWLERATARLEFLESKAAAEESLSEFIRQAWHIVEPGAPYVHGWHIDAICDHLEAITYGEFNRLLINVPPGMMKSLCLNVFWPAWEWGPRNIPHNRFVCTSHSQNLAIRDSTKMRRLVQSDWYQQRWGGRVKLTGDVNAKTKFETTATGFREAVAFESMTGVRGNRVTIDDPHSVDSANSDAMRASTIETFLEAVPTRLSDPIDSAIVVIMQRLHEGDVSGVILDKGLGYEHLCLPMEFDPVRKCRTSIGFEDPRTEEGELLFPERFPRDVVERDKRVMGPYACTPFESPILMADLTYKAIGEVNIGDEIVGFTTDTKNGDTWKPKKTVKTEIINKFTYQAEVVKITLSSGKVIRCTPDHKWYMGKQAGTSGLSSSGKRHFKPMYRPAIVGRKLMRVSNLEDVEVAPGDVRDAGWLAGFFDGDGSCSFHHKRGTAYDPSVSITFYQGAGRNSHNCNKLEHVLQKFGFEYSISKDERKDPARGANYEYRQYRIVGKGLPVYQKFLHQIQPTKWRDRLLAGAYGPKFIIDQETVVNIEPDGVETVYALETGTGNYVVWGLASSNSAGQFQQSPAPRGGGIIKRDWWRLYDEEEAAAHGARDGAFPPMDFIVASLDPAYTALKENDPSALTIWGVWQHTARLSRAISDIAGERVVYDDGADTAPVVMLMHAWQKRLPIHGPETTRQPWEDDLTFRRRQKEQWGLVETVTDACKKFKVDALLIEAKGPGISVGQSIKALHKYDGFSVRLIDPGKADKIARAYAIQPIFSNGQVFAPDRSWADMVISQFESFPRGAHDDLVDSTTQALKFLRDAGLLRRTTEIANEVANELRHRRPTLRPVYEA